MTSPARNLSLQSNSYQIFLLQKSPGCMYRPLVRPDALLIVGTFLVCVPLCRPQLPLTVNSPLKWMSSPLIRLSCVRGQSRPSSYFVLGCACGSLPPKPIISWPPLHPKKCGLISVDYPLRIKFPLLPEKTRSSPRFPVVIYPVMSQIQPSVEISTVPLMNKKQKRRLLEYLFLLFWSFLIDR